MDQLDICFFVPLLGITLLMAFKLWRLKIENSTLKKDVANLFADRNDLGLAIDQACKTRPELALSFGGVYYLEGEPQDARHYFIHPTKNPNAIIDITARRGQIRIVSFREADQKLQKSSKPQYIHNNDKPI